MESILHICKDYRARKQKSKLIYDLLCFLRTPTISSSIDYSYIGTPTHNFYFQESMNLDGVRGCRFDRIVIGLGCTREECKQVRYLLSVEGSIVWDES